MQMWNKRFKNRVTKTLKRDSSRLKQQERREISDLKVALHKQQIFFAAEGLLWGTCTSSPNGLSETDC